MSSDPLPHRALPDDAAEQRDPPRHIPLRYTLIASFMLMILPVLAGLSWFNYQETKEETENAYHMQQQQTENNIAQVLRLIEQGRTVLENFLEREIEHNFVSLVEAYNTTGEPADLKLDELKQRELDNRLDIYLLNLDGVVEYTTSSDEIGFDFKDVPGFVEFLEQAKHRGDFVSTGLLSKRWGDPRLYGLQLSADGRYILQLGADPDAFKHILGDLTLARATKQLRATNPTLLQIRVFAPDGLILGGNQRADPERQAIVEKVYAQRQVYEISNPAKRRQIRYLFVRFGKGEERSNKVVELTYNTWQMQYTLEKKAGIHFIISSVAIVVSLLSSILLSAWITYPIKRIVEGIDRIAQGDLNYPIDTIEARNEIKILKQSIRIMVRNTLSYLQQMKKQNERLRELDRLKDDFLSNTSHELRTPLNGIIGLTDSMLGGAAGELPDKARDNLMMISLSGRRLSNLINDLLDFSKLKHNNLSLHLKPVELAVMAEVVLALLKPLVGDKKVVLQSRIPNNLPPVEADENRLQQILYNLLGNAVKFTDAGVVEITAHVENEEVVVTVADTGIGIPEDKHDSIFNAFEQADGSATRTYSGTGLGLSITKRLVELHKGKIWLESAPGEGTLMYFTLPISQGTAQTDMPMLLQEISSTFAEREAESQRESSDVAEIEELIAVVESGSAQAANIGEADSAKLESQLHVLIVDDEPVNLQVLENLLLMEKYLVTKANDGLQALDIMRNGPRFSLILMDVMMPKMSGFEVCRIIRKTWPASELPVIMLTAKNQISDLVAGLESGANDYLTKPFSQTELSARMRTHIQLGRMSTAYSYFVPHEFLHLLEKKSITDVRLGDHVQREMSVIFADIRSFTSISENLTPKENFEFINSYLSRISPVIRRHRGFIDKYIGDAIMALFPESPEDALNAVLEIHRELQSFNHERLNQGKELIRIGVGTHYGPLMLGTIGESKRMEGTVIADVVNLSSRLESLTKVYGVRVIVSEHIIGALPAIDHYDFRELGKVRVRGKQKAVRIFEMLDVSLEDPAVQMKIALSSTFTAAMEYYYSREFARAADKFRKILEKLPEDKISQHYLGRCMYYGSQQKELSSDWDGVEELS